MRIFFYFFLAHQRMRLLGNNRKFVGAVKGLMLSNNFSSDAARVIDQLEYVSVASVGYGKFRVLYDNRSSASVAMATKSSHRLIMLNTVSFFQMS